MSSSDYDGKQAMAQVAVGPRKLVIPAAFSSKDSVDSVSAKSRRKFVPNIDTFSPVPQPQMVKLSATFANESPISIIQTKPPSSPPQVPRRKYSRKMEFSKPTLNDTLSAIPIDTLPRKVVKKLSIQDDSVKQLVKSAPVSLRTSKLTIPASFSAIEKNSASEDGSLDAMRKALTMQKSSENQKMTIMETGAQQNFESTNHKERLTSLKKSKLVVPSVLGSAVKTAPRTALIDFAIPTQLTSREIAVSPTANSLHDDQKVISKTQIASISRGFSTNAAAKISIINKFEEKTLELESLERELVFNHKIKQNAPQIAENEMLSIEMTAKKFVASSLPKYSQYVHERTTTASVRRVKLKIPVAFRGSERLQDHDNGSTLTLPVPTIRKTSRLILPKAYSEGDDSIKKGLGNTLESKTTKVLNLIPKATNEEKIVLKKSESTKDLSALSSEFSFEKENSFRRCTDKNLVPSAFAPTAFPSKISYKLSKRKTTDVGIEFHKNTIFPKRDFCSEPNGASNIAIDDKAIDFLEEICENSRKLGISELSTTNDCSSRAVYQKEKRKLSDTNFVLEMNAKAEMEMTELDKRSVLAISEIPNGYERISASNENNFSAVLSTYSEQNGVVIPSTPSLADIETPELALVFGTSSFDDVVKRNTNVDLLSEISTNDDGTGFMGALSTLKQTICTLQNNLTPELKVLTDTQAVLDVNKEINKEDFTKKHIVGHDVYTFTEKAFKTSVGSSIWLEENSTFVGDNDTQQNYKTWEDYDNASTNAQYEKKFEVMLKGFRTAESTEIDLTEDLKTMVDFGFTTTKGNFGAQSISKVGSQLDTTTNENELTFSNADDEKRVEALPCDVKYINKTTTMSGEDLKEGKSYKQLLFQDVDNTSAPCLIDSAATSFVFESTKNDLINCREVRTTEHLENNGYTDIMDLLSEPMSMHGSTNGEDITITHSTTDKVSDGSGPQTYSSREHQLIMMKQTVIEHPITEHNHQPNNMLQNAAEFLDLEQPEASTKRNENGVASFTSVLVENEAVISSLRTIGVGDVRISAQISDYDVENENQRTEEIDARGDRFVGEVTAFESSAQNDDLSLDEKILNCHEGTDIYEKLLPATSKSEETLISSSKADLTSESSNSDHVHVSVSTKIDGSLEKESIKTILPKRVELDDRVFTKSNEFYRFGNEHVLKTPEHSTSFQLKPQVQEKTPDDAFDVPQPAAARCGCVIM